jgi:hypothetical protein
MEDNPRRTMLLTFIAALVLCAIVSYHVGLVVQHNRTVNEISEGIDTLVETFVGDILTKMEAAGLESSPEVTEAVRELIADMEGK